MVLMQSSADEDAGVVSPVNSARGDERRCIASRTIKPVAEMIRFVIGPDGAIVPDLRRKLPGRGVWVTANRGAVGEAIRRRAFAQGFKKDVTVSADLPDRVENLLEQAALSALSMARKAGRVVVGFASVEAAILGEPTIALIHAFDGAPDGARKLLAAVNRRPGGAGRGITMVTAFTTAQLDLALGRSNVVHAALLAGGASDSFLKCCHRLDVFKDGPGGHSDVKTCF